MSVVIARRAIGRLLAPVPIAILIVACAPLRGTHVAADRIFVGDIVTVDADDRVAEAVAVRDGRILAVGGKTEVLAHRGADTELVELQERALLPGFIDSHSHLFFTGLKQAMADMSPPPMGAVDSFDAIEAGLRAHERNLAAGSWLVGWGYDHSRLREGRHPTRDDLDAISTDRPVVLVHFSSHQAVLNSRALDRMDYRSNTPDPEGGVIQRRPGSREPNGIVQERAWLPVFARISEASFEERVDRVDAALELYVSKGFTTVQEGALADPDAVRILETLADRGRLPVDVVLFPIHEAVSDFEGVFESPMKGGRGFRFGGVKIVLDGGSPGRTAWLREPYHIQKEGESQYRGFPHYTDSDEVNSIVRSYYARNIPLNIHALGDAAVQQAIDAVKFAEEAFPGGDRRTNLIHLQVLGEDQLDELAELDVTLTFQVAHNYYFGDFHHAVTLGPQRAARLNPARSALDRGLRFTLHHDSPVHPVDPLRLIDAAVNRITSTGRVLGAAERIPISAAIRASTAAAAYQYFEENEKGTIEVGKWADFVILSRSPHDVEATRLADLEVLETIRRGRTIFRKGP